MKSSFAIHDSKRLLLGVGLSYVSWTLNAWVKCISILLELSVDRLILPREGNDTQERGHERTTNSNSDNVSKINTKHTPFLDSSWISTQTACMRGECGVDLLLYYGSMVRRLHCPGPFRFARTFCCGMGDTTQRGGPVQDQNHHHLIRGDDQHHHVHQSLSASCFSWMEARQSWPDAERNSKEFQVSVAC